MPVRPLNVRRFILCRVQRGRSAWRSRTFDGPTFDPNERRYQMPAHLRIKTRRSLAGDALIPGQLRAVRIIK